MLFRSRSEPLALYAIHPPPPINDELAGARDEKLVYVANKVVAQASTTPIVVGDFNVTPWSPAYTRFVQASGLRALREPWRLNHTWPVTGSTAYIGINIDHTFAHPSLALVKREIGPDLGSDHMPVTVTMSY